MGSYQSVDVYVLDNTPAHEPVVGMLVRVFNTSGGFFTQEVTDSDGHAGFTLWSQEYDLRFYKAGVQVKQPQRISISETLANEFNISATVFVHPVANDPRLCRASGYFRDISGAPQPNVDMQFLAEFNPILLEGAAVLSERRTIRTDGDGYACIDLIRCAKYLVTLQGLEDEQRQVSVPDLPSANLPDLLFTVVAEITFDPEGPYIMAVGEILDLTPTVIGSNQVPLEGTATGDVRWYSSDETVLCVSFDATQLHILARAAGTAQILAERNNKSIISIPDTGIQGIPQTVTVA